MTPPDPTAGPTGSASSSGSDDAAPSRFSSLLERVGLHRPELRAWAWYDWANSAFMLTVLTTIYPIYFTEVAASHLDETVATRRHAWVLAIAAGAIALAAPVLGALADYLGIKKRLLGVFLGIGAAATASLWFVHEGDWLLAATLFGIAHLGAQGSIVFYDSLLPHVARDDEEMDRVSTSGYAVGYFGSSLLLILQIAWTRWPEAFGLPGGDAEPSTVPVRLAFVSVAVWWVLFSIPLFRRVSEPPRQIEPDEVPHGDPFRVAIDRLKETFGEIRHYRNTVLMLIAFLIYNDGIGTIIKMGTIYGAELGIDTTVMIVAVLAIQIVGVPFAFLFGALAGVIGPKRAILLGLTVYVGITSFAYFMTTATHFVVLAILVGLVQGGTQALSRSLFASMIPRHKSSEFFGFFAVLAKFSGVFGPLFFAIASQTTGSSRQAILTVIVFFVVGGALLWRVDVEEGRAAARAADRGVRPVSE
ncbi:MAG: MFS transporter [Gemmatimonadota bacterium]|nr:MFS transporter [Gemmatimonadota bacterium]